MRCALLGEPTGWHIGRLTAALRDRGHEATMVRWNELAAEVGLPADRRGEGHGDEDGGGTGGERFLPAAIGRADMVVVRGMPVGSLEEVIFRMDLLSRLARRGMPVVNSPKSLEVAIDKYLSLALLAEAGIPVPRTIVAQNAASIEAAWDALGRDAVVKPLFGSRGRGIERLTSRDQLAPYLVAAEERPAAAGSPPESRGTVCYLQEFISHPGWDVRVLLVGERAFAMRRVSSVDWRLNVARGARAEPFAPPADWVDLARRAAKKIGTEIAGVDLLPTRDGRLFVVEINAVPGWRGLEGVVGQDISQAVVEYLEQRLRQASPDCPAVS
jgi:ribosomal protein S6--L-glutamate ligase